MDFNISLRSPTDPNTFVQLSGTETVDKTTGAKTLTILENASESDPAGGQPKVVSQTLTIPLSDLNGIDPQQLTAAVGSLQAPLSALPACAALMGQMLQTLTPILDNLKGAPPPPQVKQEQLNRMFQLFGDQAGQVGDRLYSMLQNAHYRQNTKFITAMIDVSQTLRQLSNVARQNAINAEFQNTMQQAQQIVAQAQDEYNSAMKDITASYIQAGFELATAVVTIGFTIGGFKAGTGLDEADQGLTIGTKDLDQGLTEADKGLMAGNKQLYGSLGQGIGQVLNVGGTIGSNILKTQAAEDKKQAGLDQAAQKVLEGYNKQIQNQENIANDLYQTAQSLLDATLKMFQSTVDSLAQSIQQLRI
jgi:hypothetical protein